MKCTECGTWIDEGTHCIDCGSFTYEGTTLHVGTEYRVLEEWWSPRDRAMTSKGFVGSLVRVDEKGGFAIFNTAMGKARVTLHIASFFRVAKGQPHPNVPEIDVHDGDHTMSYYVRERNTLDILAGPHSDIESMRSFAAIVLEANRDATIEIVSGAYV